MPEMLLLEWSVFYRGIRGLPNIFLDMGIVTRILRRQ